jgi:hypothetical protein
MLKPALVPETFTGLIIFFLIRFINMIGYFHLYNFAWSIVKFYSL